MKMAMVTAAAVVKMGVVEAKVEIMAAEGAAAVVEEEVNP